MRVQTNFIDEIRANGLKITSDHPHIADTLGNPGHHNGSFRVDLRRNGAVPDAYGNKHLDETNYWMTESIDVARWFRQDTKLLETLGLLTIAAPTISEFATPEYAAFLAMMHGFWPEAAHIFCYNGGTLATDAAAKAMVAQVMQEEGLRPQDMKIASLAHAFHGRAGWGLELTDRTPKTKDWQTDRAVRIPSPAIVFDDAGNVNEDATGKRVAVALEKLEQAFQKNAEVAGIMLEYPFQAEGGALLLPKSFLQGARILCDTYRRFLTVDAVQMAGKGYPFPPEVLENADYVAFGKFFRVCGVMAKNPARRGFREDHMATPGKYGATWAGRLADMIAAQAIVSVIDRNNLWENGRKQAQRMYKGLRKLSAGKKGVLRPRIWGAYIGFDFATKDARNAFVAKARVRHHMLFLSAGETAIRWSPRLDATASQVNHVLDVVKSIL